MERGFCCKWINSILDMLLLRHLCVSVANSLWDGPQWPLPMAFKLFPISSTWIRATFIDLLVTYRLCQSAGMLFPSYITKALWLSSCMFSSNVSSIQEKPATVSWGSLVVRPMFKNLQPVHRWHVTKQLSRPTPMPEPPYETMAIVNSLVAIQPLPNRLLWFSRKHIIDSFLLIYLFTSGYCIGCNLSQLSHQKTHHLVCLVQRHLEEWLAHSHSKIII